MLQLQAIIDHAISMEGFYTDLHDALDVFNGMISNDNTILCPFHNFAQITEQIPHVPNSDVHLSVFVSFLTNPGSLGINFNISQHPTPITKLNDIIRETRESSK